MKFHLIKRSIAQEVADELDNTIRQRREALEHVEYWGAAHAMLTDREQRLRNELAEHAGTQTLPVRLDYVPTRAPLDKAMRRTWFLVWAGALWGIAVGVCLLMLLGVKP